MNLDINAIGIFAELIELQFTEPVTLSNDGVLFHFIGNNGNKFPCKLFYDQIVSARYFEILVVNRYFGLLFEVNALFISHLLNTCIGGSEIPIRRNNEGDSPRKLIVYTPYCMNEQNDFIQRIINHWNQSCTAYFWDINFNNGDVHQLRKIPNSELKNMLNKERFLLGRTDDGTLPFIPTTTVPDADIVMDLKLKSNSTSKKQSSRGFSFEIQSYVKRLQQLCFNVKGVVLPLNFGNKLMNVLDKATKDLLDFQRLITLYHMILVKTITDNKYLTTNVLIIPIPVGTRIMFIVWMYPQQSFVVSADEKESKMLIIDPRPKIGSCEEIALNKLHLAIFMFYKRSLEELDSKDLKLVKSPKWTESREVFEPRFDFCFEECFDEIFNKIKIYIKENLNTDLEDNFGLHYIDETSNNIHFLPRETVDETRIKSPSFNYYH
uniref:Uncharacterized protein n=1 Tax=Panagrolaimus sp. JU765 TaxID=591449 RepID=A0AC34RTC9_9BILA